MRNWFASHPEWPIVLGGLFLLAMVWIGSLAQLFTIPPGLK